MCAGVLSSLDELRLGGTVESTVALIFLVLSFESLYERSLACLIWLALAATTHMVGKRQLRSAEGWKLTPVKSGDLPKGRINLQESKASESAEFVLSPSVRDI